MFQCKFFFMYHTKKIISKLSLEEIESEYVFEDPDTHIHKSPLLYDKMTCIDW